ncbi:MAG: hypothetical protein ACE5EU_12970 [Paracoccaceae bacterium]
MLLLLAIALVARVPARAQTTYDLYRADNRSLSAILDPVDDDVRFSVTLRDKETGFERRHEFDGEGANDPSPYRMEIRNYCGTPVILLTIEYPWRHALPLYSPLLETFAFRENDFEFVDATLAPLTDISLIDAGEEDPADAVLFPPVGVHCLSNAGGRPFEFLLRDAE